MPSLAAADGSTQRGGCFSRRIKHLIGGSFLHRRRWRLDPRKKKMGVKGSPVAKLTDDILVDIFSRVPYKSTCCCKCVSTRWRDLFSHPDHRKKLPQPLAGFFHEGYNKNRFPRSVRYFTNFSGKGDPLIHPSLSFLPRHSSLLILDCCNGLLLCQLQKTSDYVVCNPSTKKWVVVPATKWSRMAYIACLGFDPAVSSHFHVFEFIDEETWGIPESEQDDRMNRIQALAIYSSKAGVWGHQTLDRFELDRSDFAIPNYSRSIFLNGIMHVATSEEFILAVDVEGNDWRIATIDLPTDNYNVVFDDIFLSQRQLYCMNDTAGFDGSHLSVWVLEDYNSKEWILKHSVSCLDLFGVGYSALANPYSVVSVHPERNLIFIVCGDEPTLMSYDMDRRKTCFICQLGRDCQIKQGITLYLPYVPLYSEALADGH